MTVEEFDSFPYNTIMKIKESLKGDGKIKELLNDIPNRAVDKFHLLSLTDSNSRHHLWNHKDYGQKYSGLCIGYKSLCIENCYMIKVHPNQIPSKFSRNDGFPILEVKYDNDRAHCYEIFKEEYDDNGCLVFGKNPSVDNITYNLFHKTARWCNEVESRGFYYTHDGLCKVHYPDEIMDSITFGYNANSDEIEKIKDIVKQKYSNYSSVKFYRATPNGAGGTIIGAM